MCYNNLKGAKYRSIYFLIKTNGFWCPILFIFFADIPIFVTPISSMIFYHCFRWTDIFCWKPFREGLLDDSRFLKIFFCMFPFDMFTNRLRHFTTMKKFNKNNGTIINRSSRIQCSQWVFIYYCLYSILSVASSGNDQFGGLPLTIKFLFVKALD